MKQLTFCTILLLTSIMAQAQSNEFIGVMPGGGPHETGVIYKVDSVGNFKRVVHSFEKIVGHRPTGELTLAPDGSFYGTTMRGGKYFKGVLFQYFPSNNMYKVLYHFGADALAGASPVSGVLLASNGKLYGSTMEGGLKSRGILFCYDVSLDSLTNFHSFESLGGSGNSLDARLMETKNGDLLVATYYGGTNNAGAIYQIDTSNLSTTTVANFYGIGAFPVGAMVEVKPNIFYGVTQRGGGQDKGILYRFNLNTKTLTNMKNFVDQASGEYPSSGIVLANNGKIYGSTKGNISAKSDILFEFNPSDSSFKSLYTFTSAKGEKPSAVMVEGTNGVLYGTTSYGGNLGDDGTLFSYKIGEDTITKLWQFVDVKHGEASISGVTFGKDGKLYGLLREGKGAAYDGSLYAFDTSKRVFERPIFFNSSMLGTQPSGNLVQAADARLYGIAQIGGDNNLGLVFSMDANGNSVTAEASFTDSSGYGMSFGFLEASNGKLYGLCINGVNTSGSIVEFDTKTKILKKVAEFVGTTYGTGGQSGLMEAGNGDLYGVRPSGGANDNGTLFRFNIHTQTLTKLLDFEQNTKGRFPQGQPVLVNGKLYGLTYSGGANDEGILYEYNPANNQYIVKITFKRSESGKRPVGSLLLANNGLLYGTTTDGGDYSVGSLFEYNITTNTLVVKASFIKGKSSEVAIGELMQASNGYIYGLTERGGDNDYGVLFEYKIGTKVITRKFHLQKNVHGYAPNGPMLELNACKFTRTIVDAPEVSARAVLVNYQWLNCDKNYEIIPGETKQTFKAKDDGKYAVEITSRFCSDTSECVSLMPSSVHFPFENKLILYPNPSTGLVYLFNVQTQKPIEVQVFNGLGHLIHQETLELASNVLSHRFETGIYIVVLQQEEKTFVQKVVVVR